MSTTSTTDSQVPATLSSSEKQLLYVKTNLGGYFFDAALRISHKSTLKITSHPVQSGGNITDHSYLEPSVVVLEIGMSDLMESIVSGQYNSGSSRSVSAYQTFLDLQSNRQVLQLFTRLKKYRNMLISSIEPVEDYTTAYVLKATITLQEIFVAEVGNATVSARPHATTTTNRGKQQATAIKASALYKMAEAAGYEVTDN